mgnify:CR=1 FL=1
MKVMFAAISSYNLVCADTGQITRPWRGCANRHPDGRPHGAYDASFDGAADADDEEASQSPAYYLEDARYDPAKSVESDDYEKTSVDGLYVAMKSLDDRSRDILNQRWLSDNKATLHDLAAKYNVSAERIRQLEKNAMDKVKALLEA